MNNVKCIEELLTAGAKTEDIFENNTLLHLLLEQEEISWQPVLLFLEHKARCKKFKK